MTDNNFDINQTQHTWWRRISIRWKLTLMCIAASVPVLLITLSILFLRTRTDMRLEIINELDTLSEIMVYNTIALFEIKRRNLEQKSHKDRAAEIS